jgi:hypothetical protein
MGGRLNRLVHRAVRTSIGLFVIEVWDEGERTFHSATRFNEDGWVERGEDGNWTPRDLADSVAILGLDRDEAERIAYEVADVLDDHRSAAAEPLAPLSLRLKVGVAAAVLLVVGLFALGLVAAVYLVMSAVR